MAAPLYVRLIMDAFQYLKTQDTVVSSNTRQEASTLKLGDALQVQSIKAVQASLRTTEALQTEVAGYRELAASVTQSAKVRTRANLLAERSQARLNSSLGLSSTAFAGSSHAVKTGEKDLGKFTRGALAGSGAASSLGRSLAFASTGFIAIAAGSTLIAASIKAAIDLEKTQRQVDRQLKTGGKSWVDYGQQIDQADLKLSHVSGFTNQELLQSFTGLFRVTDNVSHSLQLNAVAADVARGRNISLASASNALAKAAAGSFSSLRKLNIIVPQGSTVLQALAFVAQKYAGQAAAGATVSDKFHAALVDTEEVIGTALLPAFTRATTAITDWLAKMTESGRLQRDVNEAVSVGGDIFHALGATIGFVDRVTGSFAHTLEAALALFALPKIVAFGNALLVVAGNWGLVGKAAVTAAAEQDAALGASGAGAAGGISLGAALTGGLAGSVLGKLPVKARSFLAARSAAGVIGAGVAGEAAVGLSATGIGALAVAAVIATSALDSLAKKANKAAGGPGAVSQGIDVVAGVLSGGLVGNSRFGILGQALHGFPGFGSKTPEVPITKAGRAIDTALQDTSDQFNRLAAAAHAFATRNVKKTIVFKTFTDTITNQLAQARAALTKSTADDVVAAKAEIALIKRGIARGHYAGASLIQALQAEASAQGVLDNARQAAAAQAAKIAAAKQAAASTYATPIDLQLAEARAQLTKSTADDVKVERQILAAAKAALNSGKKNKQGQLAALQVMLQAQQAIQSFNTQANSTFTLPLKLQLALAKAQALGTDQTKILLKMKAALERALKGAKGNIQKQIDIWNQIASINQQLGSSVTGILGNFKQASTRVLTAGLGLTPAQRKALRARLSQLGPGGTVPGGGVGAGGFIIDPTTGRPIRPGHGGHSGGGGGRGAVTDGAKSAALDKAILRLSSGKAFKQHITVVVELDGKQIASSTTTHQQRRRARNPSQRRGPNAGN